MSGWRGRIRAETGKCEGRKSHTKARPEAVTMAKRLHRASPTRPFFISRCPAGATAACA